MDQSKIKEIINNVLKEMNSEDEDGKKIIPVEASAKHTHLCKEDVEELFGKGYKLTPKRELSQPGQFLSEERINIMGPKGIIKNVAVLGPERSETQVEISKTDAISLGINAPLRDSGDTDKSGDIFISAGKNIKEVKEAAIIARRHIHMRPEDAKRFELKDKDIVSVRILSNRPVIFEDVLVRVNENYSLNMHLDFDEANACNLSKDTKGEILA
ncbi:MAG: phosphate propanoyltransferase [Senegalia sp. (in: firmicutes)]|uniref:phosphate propanoyltransferase n=1 Tax=Senegalia sp. (in: firmicutes) TaxID=1924098 RepID=UPI003F9D6412